MGCYPFRKMMSRLLGKDDGKQRRRPSRGMIYSPPPFYSQKRTVAKSVNFSSDNPIIVIPPETNAVPKHYSETVISPSPQVSNAPTGPEVPEPFEPDRTRRFDSEPGPNGGISSGPVRYEPGPSNYGPVYSGPVHYVPSPLPRWEEYGTRRREYFSGEYCYYPTPLRDGIYSIATDPNRLTTMFSEENPNACSIV